MKAIVIRTAAVAAYLVLGSASGDGSAAEWKPEKPVELIAVNAPGGGSDRILRIMIKILQERRYVPVPMSVINKPGGGSAVAYHYANQHPGNGHYLVMGARAILTNNIAGHGPSYNDLTPLVYLFDEYIAVTVKPVSPIRSGKDLVAFVRKDPGAVTFGIATSIGNANHQGVAAALKHAGVDMKKMKNVIFPSGGAATTALMGGHIDVVPVSVGFTSQLLRNNQVRAIAVTSRERLPGVFKDVPTWKEQGHDVEVAQWRMLVGPRGMTKEQIAYWEGVFRRMMDDDAWKAELEANFWRGNFKGSDESRRFLARDNEDASAFLTELGLAKTSQLRP